MRFGAGAAKEKTQGANRADSEENTSRQKPPPTRETTRASRDDRNVFPFPAGTGIINANADFRQLSTSNEVVKVIKEERQARKADGTPIAVKRVCHLNRRENRAD